MVPLELIFCSMEREEGLAECQQKHAFLYRFLRALLCSNDTFNPGHNRKMLNGKRTSNPDRICFTYGKCFVHCNAPLEKYVNETQKENVLPRVIVTLPTLDQISLSLR